MRLVVGRAYDTAEDPVNGLRCTQWAERPIMTLTHAGFQILRTEDKLLLTPPKASARTLKRPRSSPERVPCRP